MAVDLPGLFPRGKTYSQVPSGVVGLVHYFADVDPTTQPPTKHTNDTVKCRLVQNDSSGTLTSATRVTYKSGEYREEIGATAGAATAHGVVDEYINGTVADGDYFWLVEEGNCKCRGDSNVTINTRIKGVANGEVTDASDAAPTDEECGRALATNTVDEAEGRIFFKAVAS